MNLAKSLVMQNRAKERIPGMTQLLSKRPDMFSAGVWPGYYSKAEGVEIWDLDGNRYVDMSMGGIGANVLGYADPDVDRAVHEAIKAGSSSTLNCSEEVELADLLCEIHPWAEKVRFTRSGGESMAVAIRIARAHTGRDKVAFCGYHGWHDWYLAANLGTEDVLGEHLLSGLSPSGVPSGLANTAFPFRYNHIEDLRSVVAQHASDLAVVVMEPIRSEYPAPGFLEEVRELSISAGAVLIVDEISSGFRMNSGGAHLLYDFKPDMAVFSKALGNGYPIGAVIGRGHIMSAAQDSFISSTMWTERIGPTAALATIRKHRKYDMGIHLQDIGKRVQEGWKDLACKHGLRVVVSGIYPLGHFGFQYENPLSLKALYIQFMLEKGFLASNMFYAMFAHQTEHVDLYLQSVDESFAEISKAINDGTTEKLLRGLPAGEGFKRLT
ncbi:MAG: aminotransferase class III-fold pyridoxal phosphate-dependent enzyme [Planctomycetes bacterium]|nr:aminotransferase class III-fold pyridoxal phosphate-dependent enzyme [Planctomycetota bacterium]